MKRCATILSLAICLLLPSGRAESERPKIGLVLGGGGALGFAHVGVLQVMEELQVPVDYIGGTSMGSIVAGMYACGMSPEEIETSFTSLDWWEVLKDRSPYPYMDYRRKIYAKRFMGLEFGLQDWNLVFPPGMAHGQKLNNVLETFTLNSTGITDFDRLNIPYRAVATDLISGSQVVLDSGRLATAMRASMAVPGAFTPVHMDGMVLVDGGILNNIPVDAVRDMGADIIIAVDVGASSANKSAQSDFRSLGDIVGRTYTLMQRPDQEKQLANADLVIAPDLTEASASRFHKAADIIPKGHEAADALREQLSRYSVSADVYQAYREQQRVQHTGEIQIRAVRVSGNKAVSETVIRDRIKTEPGAFSYESVRDDLSRIHGMGDFQTVNYDLVPENGAYALEYRTAEKFWGPTYLHFGLKIETATDAEALWSLLLNYTRTQLNPLGGELRFDLLLGGHKRLAEGEWYQPVSWGEQVFLAPSASVSSEDIDVYQGNTDIADIDQVIAYGALDAGISFFEYGEIRAGVLGGYADVEGNSGVITLPEVSDTIAAGTARLRLDQLDHPVFPRSGYRLAADGLFAFEEMGSSETYSTLEMQLLTPFSMGHHTWVPALNAGSSLGTDLPFYALFDVGGIDSFAGLAPYQLRGNYYAVGQLEYRYRFARLPPTLGNGLFAILRGDAGNAWFNADEIQFENLNYGLLAGMGADTVFGSMVIAVGKAEGTRTRFYFTFGNVF
jgi:NTE family protein